MDIKIAANEQANRKERTIKHKLHSCLRSVTVDLLRAHELLRRAVLIVSKLRIIRTQKNHSLTSVSGECLALVFKIDLMDNDR